MKQLKPFFLINNQSRYNKANQIKVKEITGT